VVRFQCPTYKSNTDFHEIGNFILFTSVDHLECSGFKNIYRHTKSVQYNIFCINKKFRTHRVEFKDSK